MSDKKELKNNPKKMYAIVLLILAVVAVLILCQQGYLFCRGAAMKREMVKDKLHFLYIEKGTRGILLLVFKAVCLLATVHLVLSYIVQEIANQNTEAVTERAKVLRKEVLTDYNENISYVYGYCIYFETPSEEKLKMRVTKPMYNMVKTGDSGMLTRKGTRFCGFEPEKKNIQ